ncbi:MAG TPA: mannosyltransferase family protein [Solirubrobacteraceae bacterium]|nr:mannosyltransferase family protein [Solirubrobacteraceae bacterium]
MNSDTAEMAIAEPTGSVAPVQPAPFGSLPGAFSDEPVALEDNRAALDSNAVARDGSRAALDGNAGALEGGRAALEGGAVALDGELTALDDVSLPPGLEPAALKDEQPLIGGSTGPDRESILLRMNAAESKGAGVGSSFDMVLRARASRARSTITFSFPLSALDVAGRFARLRADAQRMTAVRDTWHALWRSRLALYAVALATVLVVGFGPSRVAFNPPGITRGLGRLGDLLAAPVARWDSSWYLVIAHYGYRPDLGVYTSSRTAFFPLYPVCIGAISRVGVPPVLAGVLLSLAALAFALYGIHRLTTLELARLVAPRRAAEPLLEPTARSIKSSLGIGHSGDVARLAVLTTAFAPMAFYLSAVYSESLYLALSVGVFWCARQGRWAAVGLLGALAGATRSAGIMLLLPALILYLYGPREDRPPDFPSLNWPRPVYRMRRDLLWLGALPAGAGLYMSYLALAGGDALMPFHAQDVWSRHFAGPYLAVWDGAQAAFDGLRQLLSLQRTHVYFPRAPGSPFVVASHNLMLFAFLLAAIPAIVGVLRRLPFAYGAYVLAALALPLSYPVSAQPLMSLPRFLVVLFPLNMCLAARLAANPRARAPLFALCALISAVFVGEFATWHWVA